LRLPCLDAQVAWELGTKLRTLAEERGLAVVIDVRRFGQPLFYAALDSTTPDNAEWVRKKSTWWPAFIAARMAWIEPEGEERNTA